MKEDASEKKKEDASNESKGQNNELALTLYPQKILVSNDYIASKINFPNNSKITRDIHNEFLNKLNETNWDKEIELNLADCVDFTKSPDLAKIEKKNVVNYNRYRKHASNLSNTLIEFNYGDDNNAGIMSIPMFEVININSPIEEGKIRVDRGTVKLKLNPALKDLLINVGSKPELYEEIEEETYKPTSVEFITRRIGGHTELDYYSLKQLGSSGAVLLYNQLARWRNNGKYVYYLDKFYTEMELINQTTGKKKYNRIASLKKQAIDIWVKDINYYSDLHVEYEFNKKTKPTAIIFRITKNAGQQLKAFTNDPSRIEELKRLEKERRSLSDSNKNKIPSSKEIHLKKMEWSKLSKEETKKYVVASKKYIEKCFLTKVEVLHIINCLYTLDKMKHFFQEIYKIDTGKTQAVSSPRGLIITIFTNLGVTDLKNRK